MDGNISEKQKQKILPAAEARTLLVELMHEGYDTYCSEIDDEGNLTVIWPASINVGKQLKKLPSKTRRPLTTIEKSEYNNLANNCVQMTLDDFISASNQNNK